MSTAVLESTPKTLNIQVPGKPNQLVERNGGSVNSYLKAIGSELKEGQVPVVGGVPVSGDTIVPESAPAITVAPVPENG